MRGRIGVGDQFFDGGIVVAIGCLIEWRCAFLGEGGGGEARGAGGRGAGERGGAEGCGERERGDECAHFVGLQSGERRTMEDGGWTGDVAREGALLLRGAMAELHCALWRSGRSAGADGAHLPPLRHMSEFMRNGAHARADWTRMAQDIPS